MAGGGLHAILREPRHGGRIHQAGRDDSQHRELRAERCVEPGAPIPIGCGNESDGALQRFGALRRPDELFISFINYYPFGAAIALALDLEMRARSKGHLSLDDYMRTMWRVHGKPGGSQPGLVARPYDPRMRATAWPRRWTIVQFAADFFARYIEGREVPDYARLLLLPVCSSANEAPASGGPVRRLGHREE